MSVGSALVILAGCWEGSSVTVPRPLVPWHGELSGTARFVCSLSCVTKREPAAVRRSEIAEQLSCSAQGGLRLWLLLERPHINSLCRF